MAENAAMKIAERATGRHSDHGFAFHWPDWRVKGA